MQDCGLSDEGCSMILQLVQVNTVIEVFDVRNNGSSRIRNLEIMTQIVKSLAKNHQNVLEVILGINFFQPELLQYRKTYNFNYFAVSLVRRCSVKSSVVKQ